MCLDHCVDAGGVSFCLRGNLGGRFASVVEQLRLDSDAPGRFESLGSFYHFGASGEKAD